MRIVITTICLLLCLGCASPREKRITAQAVLTAYAVGDMNTHMSDGENEWCEWHDGARFRIEQPEEWEGATLTVFFPSEVSHVPLRAIVGTRYEFSIAKEHLKSGPSARVFAGALQDLREITGKPDQEIHRAK